MNETRNPSASGSRSGARRARRWLLLPVLLVVASVAGLSNVAFAGIGAATTPTFPVSVTVGQTNVPATIDLRNDNTAPNEGEVNTVCNANDAAPQCGPNNPGITLIPACGDATGPFSTCTAAGADPGTFQISSTATGVAGTCVGLQFSVTMLDPAFGQVRFTPFGGAHVTLPGKGSFCRIGFTFDVLKMPKVDANGAAPGVQTVQIIDHTQFSATPASARGTSTGITVVQAQPSIATTASGTINLGGSLTDNAVVTGRFNPQPGGTIDFNLYGPNDATCAGPPVFQSLGVPYPVAGGPVTSAPFVPSSPGVYRWVASYSGDANNFAVSGACNDANESVTVAQATPTINTTASATVRIGGGTLTDNAVVNGRVNPQPGATVSFRLYGPDDTTCANPPIFESLNVPYPVAGGPVTSAAFTPTVAGVYRWRATYSGDANNVAVTGACNDANENVTVTPGPAIPAIATTASGTVPLGGQLTDTAIVSGRVNPVAGATIDFRLYGPNDGNCANPPVFESLGVPYPVAGGPVTSAPFTPTVAGVYRWRATYSGDANNASVAGLCNDANENVTVTPVPQMLAISTTASGTVAVGGQLTDTAVVTGRVNPVDGATVSFRLYGPNDDTCANAPIFESLNIPYPAAGGPVTSGAFTPTVPGVYRWRATYNGDANNAAIAGECNAPNESVVVLPPPIVLPGVELPATGSHTGEMIAIGATLVLAGWLLVGSANGNLLRRRTALRR